MANFGTNSGINRAIQHQKWGEAAAQHPAKPIAVFLVKILLIIWNDTAKYIFAELEVGKGSPDIRMQGNWKATKAKLIPLHMGGI